MSISSSNALHFCSYFTLFLLLVLVPSCALNSDGTLLLSFKYSVLSDPLLVIDNWDYNDETPCSWTGVKCAAGIGTLPGSPATSRVISLVLPNSQLLGSIPEDLGLIEHLQTLDLSGNFLNGTFPTSLFNSSELQFLSLSNNKISGELPELAGVLISLQFLNLSDNALAGKLPEKLPLLKNLTVVSLRSNYFTGSVPSGFNFIQILDLSSNLLNGSLPSDFGGQSLKYLNLSSNNLFGSISSESVKKIPSFATIDLSFNNLTGEIPQSIALDNQKTESFEGNSDLCGKPLKKLCLIPSTLSSPPNASTNTSSPAIAAIPKTFGSSPVTNLPGTPTGSTQNQEHRGLKPGTIVGITIGDLAGIGVLAMVILFVYQLKKKRRNESENETQKAISCIAKNSEDKGFKEDPSVAKDSKVLSTWSCLSITNGEETSEATGSDSDENYNNKNKAATVDVSYSRERKLAMVDGETELEIETLLKASAYVLGSSGQGIVYKAVLEDGTEFAVRRIGESGVERLKDFESQVRVIAKLRHPNVVRLRGFYWGDDEKLVIYDYVSNGSLASACYKKMGSSPCHLPFKIRLNIAKGVARGLTYIHDKKHVHGNIKPTNILLNFDMEPIISDLGLDRLIFGHNNNNNNNNKRGGPSTRHFGSKRSTDSQDLPMGASFMGRTSPYHAPESLENLKPNPKWDVYSFGIVLLELLTGRVLSDRELGQWTAGSVVEDKDRVLRMADVAIRADVEGREDAMLACFKLGFGCASLVPQKRPQMKEALQVLEKISCSPN